MTKLEEIAFALFVRRGLTHAFGDPFSSWERSRDTIVGRECMEDARAAIEAMREPTIKMLRAADNVILTDDELHAGPYEMIKAEYRAAIDAALSEGKETET